MKKVFKIRTCSKSFVASSWLAGAFFDGQDFSGKRDGILVEFDRFADWWCVVALLEWIRDGFGGCSRGYWFTFTSQIFYNSSRVNTGCLPVTRTSLKSLIMCEKAFFGLLYLNT